ncbi:hypothetical protein [Janthinobacterium sp. UMAB-56]|uniref:hypothetical protein n=1 Tax=Janthinobacterium sp. UMAB-56 TaxID=1365361 RepID=UPI001C570540|nr:hypothetical protein [Janthinobacterium sp. UMAB-56]
MKTASWDLHAGLVLMIFIRLLSVGMIPCSIRTFGDVVFIVGAVAMALQSA